ncbi:MAG: hypothetical protein R2744_12965 [Bacteroidales bacterium]
MKKLIILLLFLFLLTVARLYPQQEMRIDSLTYIELLKRIENLEETDRSRSADDELKKLMEDAGRLAAMSEEEKQELNKKFHSGVRQQQGLNPNISVLGDFFGALSSSDDSHITEPSEYTSGNNGIYMRSLELSFVSTLDPFARGKAFLDISESGVSIEEAYMELINLPLNSSLKAGVFFPEYGLLNRHHTHALPQFDRPVVCSNYLGLDGFNGVGVALNFMLPLILWTDASSLDISVINDTDNPSFPTSRSSRLLYTAHLKNYYDIDDASYFEYTLSGLGGRSGDMADGNNYLATLGLHYKWEPPSMAKYRSLDLRTEFYYGSRETFSGKVESFGFYSLFHRKLNARFWAGGRVGYAQLPYDSDQSQWDFTANFDYWQSEFVFFRLQYQYNSRDIYDIPGDPGVFPSDHTLLLQFSWAMGPHKHEAY